MRDPSALTKKRSVGSMMDYTHETPCSESEAAESLLALLNVIPKKKLGNDASDQKEKTMSTDGKQIGMQEYHSRSAADVYKNTSSSIDAPGSAPSSVQTEQSSCDGQEVNSSLKSGDAASSDYWSQRHTNEISRDLPKTASSAQKSPSIISSHGIPIPTKCVPEVLMHLLLQPEYHKIIHFLPDGRTFVIENANEFGAHLMKQYFKLTKFGCFVGKLERWGFTHYTDNERNCHMFHHPLFIRADWISLAKIKYSPRSTTMNANKDDANSYKKISRLPNSTEVGFGTVSAFHPSIHDTAAKLRNEVNRCHELSNLCHSQGTSNSLMEVEGIIPQSAVCSATKDIVEAAIECLMRDEDHTANLLARRGNEIRRPNVSSDIERMVQSVNALGTASNLTNNMTESDMKMIFDIYSSQTGKDKDDAYFE